MKSKIKNKVINFLVCNGKYENCDKVVNLFIPIIRARLVYKHFRVVVNV